MKTGIVGSGYVGKNIGRYMQEKKFEVKFYDVDNKIIAKLKNNGFNATVNINEISECKYIFVSVPTPTNSRGEQILEYIINAINKIVTALKNNVTEHVIIIKSTLLPGTTEKVIIPMVNRMADKSKIGIIYSPEFITEIGNTWITDAKYNVTYDNDHRLVVGEGKNKKWGEILLKEIYSDINLPIIRTDYKTAEMIKYAANNALAARISYWNEIFLICKELGIDSNIVAQAASLDPRIGKYGTIHGKAFGGKCLPKDLRAFIEMAKMYSSIPLLEAVENINVKMKEKYGVRE